MLAFQSSTMPAAGIQAYVANTKKVKVAGHYGGHTYLVFHSAQSRTDRMFESEEVVYFEDYRAHVFRDFMAAAECRDKEADSVLPGMSKMLGVMKASQVFKRFESGNFSITAWDGELAETDSSNAHGFASALRYIFAFGNA